ncbi:MAG: hypothetical protein Q8R15_00850 [Candidatus Micrarchaeota archaeon]|nr:hypothetical protein [Candidatus Micrarchaeota archaeon]
MNVKSLIIFSFFALSLVIPLIGALIPSEEAIQAASVYLRQSEEASIVNRPFLVDGRQYFVVYFHPQTNAEAKNLIVVVDAETGLLVESQDVLTKVYSFDLKQAFIQGFVTEKELSLQEVNSALQSGKTARDQAETSLEDVETSLSRVDENILTVQNSFSQFTLSVERLGDEIDSGLDTQEMFESDYSNTALEAFVIRYNSTFKALVAMVKTGEDYQKAVINTSNGLTQKGVEQSLFRPGLQTAFNVGLDQFASITSLENAFDEFQGVKSPQAQRSVNDSVQSYLYRKQKIDSDNAVESVKASVQDILNRKAEVLDCTTVTELEKTWQATLAAQQGNKFVQVVGNVTLVQSELNKVKKALDKCNTQNNPAPQNTNSDNTNIFIGVILLMIVGYFVWKFTQKKPPEGGSEQSATPKGNLFGS